MEWMDFMDSLVYCIGERGRCGDKWRETRGGSRGRRRDGWSDGRRRCVAAAGDEAEVERLEGVARAARRTLIDLVGRGTASLASLPIAPVTASPPAPPATTPGELLERRPDVREAEARLRSAEGFGGVDGAFRFGRDGVAERRLEVQEVRGVGAVTVSRCSPCRVMV